MFAYDITDDRRRGHVADALLSYGERVQDSVYVVGTSKAALVRLKRQVQDLINCSEDSVLVIDLGPCDEWGSHCDSLGKRGDSGLSRDCVIL